MQAMVHGTPPLDAFHAFTRAGSFHGYPDGDTQPMDTQVYRDYHDSMIKPSKTVLRVDVSPGVEFGTYDTVGSTVDKTPHTLVEGEPGYVDLGNAWQPNSPLVHGNSDDIDDLLATPPDTQIQAPDGEERRATPQTPRTPRTSSVAGRKHGRDGETLTSAPATTKQTPRFSQLFGMAAMPPAMTASQLFHQTQALSSPISGEPRSDPLCTRPSPNLQHNHVAASSQHIITSSPETTMRARLASSTAIELRDKYFGTHETRRRRAARFREELSLAPPVMEDDDEGDSQERQLHLRRVHRVMSDQAFHDYSRSEAPSRSGSRPRCSRKQGAATDLRKPARVEFTLSDDEDTCEEDLLMNEDDHEKASANGEIDNDIYDELGQTVVRSQIDGQDDGEEDEGRSNNSNASDDGEHPDEKDQSQWEGLVGMEQDSNATARKSDGALAHHDQTLVATPPSAIADSQPDRLTKSNTDVSKRSGLQSSLSYIPGSQYVGITSEEKAHMRSSRRRPIAAGQPVPSDGMPSSPPLLGTSSAVSEDPIVASRARQELLVRFQDKADELLFSPTARDKAHDTSVGIPTTTIPTPPAARNKAESNSLHAPFSTAQTHLSASNPSPMKMDKSPLKVFASQHSRLSADSPRRAAGVRRFAEIAADPSPPTASGESQVDINAIMSDVLTADDEAFIAAISNRTQKLPGWKKPRHGNATNKCSESASSRELHVVSSNGRHVGGVLDSVSDIPDGNVVTPRSRAGTQPVALAQEDLVAIPISPSKEKEGPASTPEMAGPPKNTQDSVRKREDAGALAVSQLMTGRRRRHTNHAKSYLSKPTRSKKTANAAVDEEILGEILDKTIGNGGSTNISHPSKDGTDGPLLKRRKLKNVPYQKKSRSDPQHEYQDDVSEAQDQPVATTNSSAAQRRIFALFKGSYNNFYPATWLSRSADGKMYKVRFDDTTVTDIDPQHVRALNIYIGDQLKVDKPGMRKDVWVVKGFGKVGDTDEQRDSGIDINGHTTIQVQARASSRNSLGASDASVQSEGELKEVYIADIYLTHTMWPVFTGRTFLPPTSAAVTSTSGSRQATPSAGVQTPDDETPVSHSQRSTNPTVKIRDGRQKNSLLRAESLASATGRVSSLVFGGMAFAISYGSNEAEKSDVTRLIQRNGGLILESGFDELFELPNLDDAETASSRQEQTEETGLRLKSKYAHLGFVALIADRHSRRAKYMQALALGLPTLSGRWITDCLNAAADANNLPSPPWSRYLLPAGESVYLSGAIRSRAIPSYDVASATLANVMASRDLLLNGDGVLIVASKKNNATWERRKAYAFLTLALGAGAVRRVNELQEVKALTSSMNGGWKWVYVEGSVAEACASLFGRRGAGNGKKRKRNDGVGAMGGKMDAKAMSASDGRVRIVNDEFVVQSLILGALIE